MNVQVQTITIDGREITPTIFAQLPERAWVDWRTGRILGDLIGWVRLNQQDASVSVLWRDAGELCRDMRVPMNMPAARIQDAQAEIVRLLTVYEAVLVRDGKLEELPVRIAIRGEHFERSLYSHPCPDVRYPVISDPELLNRWIERQDFPRDIEAWRVIAMIASVVQDRNLARAEWPAIWAKVCETQQLFLMPDQVEQRVGRLLRESTGGTLGEQFKPLLSGKDSR